MGCSRGVWACSSVRNIWRCKERKPSCASSKWGLGENVVLLLMGCLPPIYICIYIYIYIYVCIYITYIYYIHYIYVYITYILYTLYIYFIYIDIHIIYISSTNTHFKSKFFYQQPRTYLESQPAGICSKKWIVWTAMLLAEALAFNKYLLSEMKYMYKTKNLKVQYGITWWRAKLSKKSKKWLDWNNNDNNKKTIQTAYHHELSCELLLGTVVLTHCIEKYESFKRLNS